MKKKLNWRRVWGQKVITTSLDIQMLIELWSKWMEGGTWSWGLVKLGCELHHNWGTKGHADLWEFSAWNAVSLDQYCNVTQCAWQSNCTVIYLRVSRCRRTLWAEGCSAAGWGIGGSVELLLRVQSPFGQWVTTNCAALPTASAGQYTTSNCKPLLFGFPFKWRCVHFGTFKVRRSNIWMKSCGLPLSIFIRFVCIFC